MMDGWMDVKITFDDANSTEQPADISFVSPNNGQAFAVGVPIELELNTSQPGVEKYRVTLDVEGSPSPITFNAPPGVHKRTLENLSEGTYKLKETVFKKPFGSDVATYKLITIQVGNALDTDDYDLNNAIDVYPNPADNLVTINYNATKEITNISLFDTVGRKVKIISEEVLPSGEHKLSFKAGLLPAGIYILQLSQGSKSIYKKIIIER